MAAAGHHADSLPRLSCPNCGSQFDWYARFSQLVVCDACDSAVVVDQKAATIAGKMSALASTPGPFWVGATGKIGRRRFHVLGRVRYRYDGGFWDEWYLAEPSGKTFWIGEDENEFTITHLSSRPVPDRFWDRAQPGARLSYGEHSYLVQERNQAVCEGGEGQLPFIVMPGTQVPYVEMVAPGGQFITIERDEHADRIFKGRHLDLSEVSIDLEKPAGSMAREPSALADQPGPVSVQAGRELSLNCFACGGALDLNTAQNGRLYCPYCRTMNDLSAPRLQCPECAESLLMPGGAAVDFVVCPCCRAEVDTSGAEPAVIGKSADTLLTGGTATFKVGDRSRFDNEACIITGHLRLKTSDSWGTYYSDEYLLYGPQNGYRWLSEEDGHFNLIVQLKDPPTLMSTSYRAQTRWDNKTWTHFESDDEQVEWVNGQLPYLARAGDTHRYSDWVAPPLKLTEEVTANEREFFLATYLSTEEIAEAFKRTPDRIPEPDGVGANQPYLVAPWRKAIKPLIGVFILVNLALFGWASYLSGSPRAIVPILKQELKTDVLSEAVSFRSRMIEVDFRSDPLRTVTNGFATVTVLDDGDRAVADFSVRWKTHNTARFKLPAAGNYRLKISAETLPAIAVIATFREGVVFGRYFLLLAIALCGWLLAEWLNQRSFERKRFEDANDNSSSFAAAYGGDHDWDD